MDQIWQNLKIGYDVKGILIMDNQVTVTIERLGGSIVSQDRNMTENEVKRVCDVLFPVIQVPEEIQASRFIKRRLKVSCEVDSEKNREQVSPQSNVSPEPTLELEVESDAGMQLQGAASEESESSTGQLQPEKHQVDKVKEQVTIVIRSIL